ncbi:hypothetical protein D3C87_1970330 [compost metagenome]
MRTIGEKGGLGAELLAPVGGVEDGDALVGEARAHGFRGMELPRRSQSVGNPLEGFGVRSGFDELPVVLRNGE